MVAAGNIPPDPAVDTGGPIVLYDGICGLCAKSVRWILRHERDHELRFAPLQGETAAALRAQLPVIPTEIDTVVYVSAGRAYLKSKAWLHAARHLRAPWRWVHVLRWVPSFLLDIGYTIVAKTRYKLFGTVDACELPAPEQRVRFLS